MTLLRITGLAILVGCAAGLFVWYGWGLVTRLLAARASAEVIASETPKSGEREAERT